MPPRWPWCRRFGLLCTAAPGAGRAPRAPPRSAGPVPAGPEPGPHPGKWPQTEPAGRLPGISEVVAAGLLGTRLWAASFAWNASSSVSHGGYSGSHLQHQDPFHPSFWRSMERPLWGKHVGKGLTGNQRGGSMNPPRGTLEKNGW